MAINKDTKFVISEIVKLLKSVLPTFFVFLFGTGVGGTVVYYNIQYVYNGESLSKDEVAQYLYDYGELQASHSELETQLNNVINEKNTISEEYNQLQSDYSKLESDYSDLELQNNQIKTEKDSIQEEVNQLNNEVNATPNVSFSSPEITMFGEKKSTTFKEYVADIDGHLYIRNDFLNFILPEKMSVSGNELIYGEGYSPKLNVITSAYMHDSFGLDMYDNSGSFIMSGKEYNNGFVNNTSHETAVYIECDEKYSKIQFTLGHIDNSGSGSKYIEIDYMDSDGEYKLAYSKDLASDMSVEDVTVDIYNTRTIKIKSNISSYYSSVKFGMADVYLIE